MLEIYQKNYINYMNLKNTKLEFGSEMIFLNKDILLNREMN